MTSFRRDRAAEIRAKSFREPVPINGTPDLKKICLIVWLLILVVVIFSGCAAHKQHPFLRPEIPHTCREEIKFYFAQYRAREIDLQDLETLCLMRAEAEKTAGETQ